MKVSEAMTAQVITITPQTTIEEAARKMSQVDTGVLPVVDGGKVVGLLTDRDIVVRAVAKGEGVAGPVSAIMSAEVFSCGADDSVADATGKMASNQVRRLVVLGEGGQLVGILSLGDVAMDYGAKAVGHTLEVISEAPATH